MKKIYYLLALLPFAFTACQKQPSVLPASYTKTFDLTLQQTDYQLLPSSDYPSKTFTFDDVADAKTYIPIILNSRDPQLGNGSIANVTYTISSPYFKLSDSLYADDAYTLTSADYLLLPGNKYTDFSTAQILAWLPYKFPTPANNTLKLLTYTYYQSGATPSAGIPATDSFLYLNGAWTKIYTLSPAQYTALGRGTYGEIIAADNATLPAQFNTLLKADATVSDTVKRGDMVYVSYKYYASGTYQRVTPLIYNGTDYVTTPTVTNTLNFIKSSGAWIPNPTVYYTLTTADTKYIATLTTTGAAPAVLTSLGSYGDFETAWTPAELNIAFIAVLTKDFTAPKVNVNYIVTYLLYTGGTDVNTTATFYYNGTTWIAGPVPQ